MQYLMTEYFFTWGQSWVRTTFRDCMLCMYEVHSMITCPMQEKKITIEIGCLPLVLLLVPLVQRSLAQVVQSLD